MKTFNKKVIESLIGVLFFAANAAQADVSRVWVKFKPAGAEHAKNALINAGAEIHYRFDDLNAFAASVPEAALPGLKKNPNIEYIEEDAKRYPSSQTVPYGVDAVQARDIWDTGKDNVIDAGAPTGNGRLVCIIDSGIKADHEDFSGVNLVGGYPSDWNNDTCGHGTHVAGTIAAANNATGVVGVSPGKVSLFFVKVFSGSSCGWMYSSTLVDAANRCKTAGANVISMSLGGPNKSNTEQTAFNLLYNAGLLSIAAAGNDGNTRNSYPASYPSVVSVAAVDSNNIIASFSQQNSQVDLAAPGVGVLSTVPFISNITVGLNTYSAGHIENSAFTDPLPGGSTTGILADGGFCDSIGSWGGKVVLCERGNISFYDKVKNVQSGGGSAAVIYNNVSGGFSGTLGDGNSSTISAISLSQEDGLALVSNSNAQSTVVSSSNGNGYEAWDGTSMATPHVSGVAALVWSAYPNKTNTEIRNVLEATAKDLGPAGRDNAYGYGLVQAYAAWAALGGGTVSNQAPTASFTSSCTGLTCNFDATSSHDSDGTIDSYAWDFGDGTAPENVTSPSHSYTDGGSYTVTLTVTDNVGATSTSSKTVSVSDSSSDSIPPVISNVTSAKTGGTSFKITWTTNEPSNSSVNFTCCGTYSDTALVTNHSMGFRGTKGMQYTYTVSSTNAAGKTATSGPYNFQN